MIPSLQEPAELSSTIVLPIECEVSLFTNPLPIAESFGVPFDKVVAEESFLTDDEIPLAFRESMEQIRLGQVIDLDSVLNEPEEE